MSFWQRVLKFLGIAQKNSTVQVVEKAVISAAEPAVVHAVENAAPAAAKDVAGGVAQAAIDNLNKNIGP